MPKPIWILSACIADYESLFHLWAGENYGLGKKKFDALARAFPWRDEENCEIQIGNDGSARLWYHWELQIEFDCIDPADPDRVLDMLETYKRWEAEKQDAN